MSNTSRTLRGLAWCFVVLVLSAAAPAQTPPQTPPKSTAKSPLPALQGEWILGTINGQSLADGGTSMSITFAGDKYFQTVNGTVNERGSFKVDTTKKPIAIDLVITEGTDAGKTQLGVIEVTGDSLRGNLNTPGTTTRPTDFAAQEGFILFVAKKKK